MKLTNRSILLGIILVATILRFYNYLEIPFTHDEFSALFRLKFDNFHDLIEKGVKTDTHPAGIQVFMYYWTNLFGTREWAVKLPFTIFGLLSVLLVYIIGKKWFNETTGLISSAYMASLQYTVMYSQIARPYISGMFFSLLMIYYWGNLMTNPQKNTNRNIALFIITASLCAYNHYFSLLLAAIVGISGILVINRNYRIKYIAAGVIVFILFVPHLRIFFLQLSMGGVEGWLAKPHNDFLLQYIYYALNYSTIAVAIAATIVVFGLRTFNKDNVNTKFIGLSIAWFILSFLIGFFYSRYINAVLQYSVLIFSFPMLLLGLFGLVENQKTITNLLLVLLILSTNILTLVYGRKHYEIFYKSIYEQILVNYSSSANKHSNTLHLIDTKEKISNYFKSQHGINTSGVIHIDTFCNTKEFKEYLRTSSQSNNQLYLGCLSTIAPHIIPLIQDYFPTIQAQSNYFGGTTFIFSKGSHRTGDTIASINFDQGIPIGWSSIDANKIVAENRASANNGYMITSDIEWGPSFSAPLSNIITKKNNFIDISLDAKSAESLNDIVLVASLDTKAGNMHWGGTNFGDFATPNSTATEWQRIHHSIKLSDTYLGYRKVTLKIYIWNKGKRNFAIDNFTITRREGNPIIYGLYEKI
ncbi:MAG: glycosyltransferase family 39 protein [Bacteroidales bacterium]|nr:glycosyltransferase family 39 protein [Bacteroidales bacterium]